MVGLLAEEDVAVHGDGMGLAAGISAEPVLGVDKDAHTLCAIAKVSDIRDLSVPDGVGAKRMLRAASTMAVRIALLGGTELAMTAAYGS